MAFYFICFRLFSIAQLLILIEFVKILVYTISIIQFLSREFTIEAMRLRFLLFWIFALFVSSAGYGQSRATFARHPAPSPDGSHVAFSYGGDLWTAPVEGGRALRITTHPVYEHSPKWSSDGEMIAFSANRSGYDDIYVIPSGGGQSKRLTFIDADNDLCCFSPDGEYIYFASHRDDMYPDYRMIYKVSVDGGTPQPVMNTYGEQASVSPDGKKILYVRDGVHWWRRHYRGSESAQVWLYDIEDKDHLPVTDTTAKTTGEDFRVPESTRPMWIDNERFVLLTDRDGVENLWEMNLDGQVRQLTDYGEDIRFPAISFHGETIAFEHGVDIYAMENGKQPQKIEIIAPIDDPYDIEKRLHYSSQADKVAFGPGGAEMILEIRGEVFASRIVDEEYAAARGEANSISGDIPARNGDFTLSAEGDSVIYVSDKDGDRELYLVYSDDPDTDELARARTFNLEKLTDNQVEDHSPKMSPDNRYLAFVRGKGDLLIFDLKKKKERTLLTGWSMLQYKWSPDGRWIAYAREDNEYNSDVFIIPAEGGESVNISRHPDEDSHPVWSDDGKKLGFRSKRRQNNWDIYYVYLTWEDHFKTESDRAEEEFAKKIKKSDDDEDKKKKDKKKDEEVAVEIDFEDIHRRITGVTSLTGEEGVFDISPDGEQFVFVADHEGQRDIYTIKDNGRDLKRLTDHGANPRWMSYSPDGKTIRYLDHRGRVYSVDAGGGKKDSYPFDAIVWVNPLEEREQKFNEVWRGLNEQFYHPDFHGYDWVKIREKYESWLKHASTEEDFGDIVRMMMGELNSSHTGYRSPYNNEDHRVGRLGVDFDFSDSGEGLLIDHVVPYGPCDRGGVHLKAGDRLLEINGEKIEKGVNIHELLNYTVYDRVFLKIDRDGDEEIAVVRPLGRWSLGKLRYSEWVENARKSVDSLSNGGLGYIHIKGMGDGSLERFEAQLFSVAEGKDGLVIDVRYNGGGWITDYLLAMLQAKRHAVTYPRDGGPGYPQGRLPLYAWVKPIIVLCNQHSFSNAEIFSHAIKTLDRGDLAGVPTPGGVISTSWTGLVDGSGYRVPLRGWYFGTKQERDPARNMEGNGAVPDVIMQTVPGQIESGNDIQLETAVKRLLEQL